MRKLSEFVVAFVYSAEEQHRTEKYRSTCECTYISYVRCGREYIRRRVQASLIPSIFAFIDVEEEKKNR